VTRGCFVAWPLDPERVAALRETVRTELDAGRGAEALLPGVNAATVSVFVREADGDAPQLAWFVEHEEGPEWRDPAAAIRDHSPLFPALAEALGDGDATVVADTAPATAELVHAALPDRPVSFDAGTSELPVVGPRKAGGSPRPDVVPLVLRVRGGLGSLFARALAGAFERTPGWLEAKFESSSLDIMEAEGMYTETLLLERGEDGYRLWWYMESGGMEQVQDAYYESDSRIARLSERVLGWVLERPERVLVEPVAATEFDLLAHAVAPDRA
jgi:hypothetical protein